MELNTMSVHALSERVEELEQQLAAKDEALQDALHFLTQIDPVRWPSRQEARKIIATIRNALAPPAAEPAQNDELFLIFFEDADRAPEVIQGEYAARSRYQDISHSWNAHLFVKIDSNHRDCNIPNRPWPAQPAPATEEAGETWQKFDHQNMPEEGLYWLVVESQEYDGDVDDYGRLVGWPTGRTCSRVMLAFLELTHNGDGVELWPVGRSVDTGYWSDTSDDEVITHFMAPSIPSKPAPVAQPEQSVAGDLSVERTATGLLVKPDHSSQRIAKLYEGLEQIKPKAQSQEGEQ